MQQTDISDEQYGILPVERAHPRSWKALALMVLLVLLSGVALNFGLRWPGDTAAPRGGSGMKCLACGQVPGAHRMTDEEAKT